MNTVEIKSDNYSVYIGDEVLQEFNCILEDYQDQYSKIFIYPTIKGYSSTKEINKLRK